MSSIGLNTGLKALLSARYMLDTVGHNLANANTPGYSRQRVDLSASLAISLRRGALVGTGVDIGRVERSVDELLNGRIQAQRGALGGLSARVAGLGELEGFLGGSDPGSLGNLLDGFFTSVSDLATAPADSILRSGMVQNAETLVSRFHDVAGYLEQARSDVQAEVHSRVAQVNGIANEIADLNVRIGAQQISGSPANDLLDRRDVLVGELAELVDVTTHDGPNGTLSVLVAGNTLIGSASAVPMSVEMDMNNGSIQIGLGGSRGAVPVEGGIIGGLLELGMSDVPGLDGDLDALARHLILSVNRLHSTGASAEGPFQILTSTNAVQDHDGDGVAKDELLSRAGLPFDVTSGALHVNVEDLETGDLVSHRIAISSTHTTVQGFIDALNDVPNLTADLDSAGHVRIVAGAGHGFDFSRRLQGNPDQAGSFGGGAASIATTTAGPFGLADGQTLSITTDPGGTPSTFTVTFDQSDFVEISQATASEVAAVINADPGAQANGIIAADVEGTLVVRSAGEGSGTSFRFEVGSALGQLGWSGFLGTTISGHDQAVEPKLSGVYSGSEEDTYTFRPQTDGVIGTTTGLVVEVLDAAGDLVTTLDVGAGYVPGTDLSLGNGLNVSFGLGQLSATNGDLFAVQLVQDPDTSDVLVALGLNSFFVGSNASDIGVREDIVRDPALLATSLTGTSGDSGLLLELLSVKDEAQAALGGASLGGFFGNVVGNLGFQTASAGDALEASDTVMQSLQNRRDAIAGVDVDEELVDLVAFEQSYAAAARYINVVNQLTQELLSLI